MDTERRLVAIMFTDIAGYTALMQQSEAKAVAIRNRHREVFDRLTEAHKGRIIHYYGDGTLSIFESSVLAVQCAVALQQEFRQQPEIPVRIGIHSGDIMITKDDIIGDAVNVASRIESMGVQGSVLVSDTIVGELRSHEQISVKSLGHFHLKHDRLPREIFAVQASHLLVPERSALGGKGMPVDEVSEIAGKQRFTLKGWVTVLIIMLVSVSLWYGWPLLKGFGSDPTVSSSVEENPRIAILDFKNMTGEPSKDLLGDMAEDWILHGMARNKLGQVISPQIIAEYNQSLRANGSDPNQQQLFRSYLKPSKIITGDYFRQAEKLVFQVAVMDQKMEQILIGFDPVSCKASEPLDCIEALTQRILGYFKTEQNPGVSLEEQPPRYQAYELFSKAKAMDQAGDSLYLTLLNQAISEDASYFEPKAYRFMYYYNAGKYQVADSLLQELRKTSGWFDRQQMLLNLYQALLDGNHRNAFRYQYEEYKITPFHLETNSNMMIFSLQLVNMPELVEEFFQSINMDDMDLFVCQTCVERLKIQAMAYIDLERYQDAIDLLEPYITPEGFWVLKKILLRAYVRSGNIERVDALMQNFSIVMDIELGSELELFVAKEWLREGRKSEAWKYLDKTIRRLRSDESNNRLNMGTCLFYREDYVAAEPLLDQAYKADTNNFHLGALLAITLRQNGKIDLAQTVVENLKSQTGPYQYGDINYALARYHAGIGERQKSLEYLLKAVSDGHWYETETFHHDPLLREYYENRQFREVLEFWH